MRQRTRPPCAGSHKDCADNVSRPEGPVPSGCAGIDRWLRCSACRYLDIDGTSRLATDRFRLPRDPRRLCRGSLNVDDPAISRTQLPRQALPRRRRGKSGTATTSDRRPDPGRDRGAGPPERISWPANPPRCQDASRDAWASANGPRTPAPLVRSRTRTASGPPC
jgi:hypothetical protein